MSSGASTAVGTDRFEAFSPQLVVTQREHQCPINSKHIRKLMVQALYSSFVSVESSFRLKSFPSLLPTSRLLLNTTILPSFTQRHRDASVMRKARVCDTSALGRQAQVVIYYALRVKSNTDRSNFTPSSRARRDPADRRIAEQSM